MTAIARALTPAALALPAGTAGGCLGRVTGPAVHTP
jgi:hypothetical protein